MGRRSRKRTTEPVAPPPPREVPAPPRAAPRAATYKARPEEAPKPAWAPFPLTELCILLAIVLLALGFFGGGDNRGLLAGAGVVLLTLSAGELALREHFAGYRSHTSLLAGAAAIIVAILLRVAQVPPAVVPPVAVLVFAAAFATLRRAFMRRSGGVGFRT
jgi:hypothetical protein